MCHRSGTGNRLDSGLIHRGEAGRVEGCTGGDKGGGRSLGSSGPGVDRDARGIQTLFTDQVGLLVDRALSGHLAAHLLARIRIASDGKLGRCVALGTEGDVVKAGLGFIVHTRRALLVAVKVDGAQRGGRDRRRSNRCADSDRSLL